MKKLLFFIFVFFFISIFNESAFAIENSTSLPNNKFGIHILFTNELENAAKLVNSNGGDWGYVTIPIQAGDRDLEKWQNFMDESKKLHIIPIIRLATEGDYFNTKVWRKPDFSDIIDFANFLDSLEWPVKNRYVIVFNEPNRSDEWGGETNPKEYAEILSYAATVFKSKSEDFFVISAGLDNASANISGMSVNHYDFIKRMDTEVPGIFNQIDGFSSHSYPNPAFSKPPEKLDQMSIASFRYERELIKSLSVKESLPVFITETGWSKERLLAESIAAFYEEAFKNVWNDEDVFAVTPFLFKAMAGPFVHFSFINADGSFSSQYSIIENMVKIKGLPTVNQKILGEKTENRDIKTVKSFNNIPENRKYFSRKETFEIIFKWLLKL